MWPQWPCLITWPLRPHPRLRIECGSDTANTYSTCVDGYNGNVLPVHMNRPVSRWGRLLWILDLVMRARWTLFVWGNKTSRNKTMLHVNRSSPCDKIQCPGETRGYVLHSRRNFRSSDPLAREEMVHVIYSVQ